MWAPWLTAIISVWISIYVLTPIVLIAPSQHESMPVTLAEATGKVMGRDSVTTGTDPLGINSTHSAASLFPKAAFLMRVGDGRERGGERRVPDKEEAPGEHAAANSNTM